MFIPLFRPFSELSEHLVPIEFHAHFWQMSPQPPVKYEYDFKEENFRNRASVTPTPGQPNFLPTITQHDQMREREYLGLTLKCQETHGCVVSTVTTDALVLKHQAISIHNAD